MPWSAGTFTRTYGSTGWQGDAAAGTPIVADRHDTNDQDLATGVNACVNKDGSNSMTGNLNMGGFIPTNLGAGTAAAPAVCAGNDQDTGMFSPAANTLAFATNGTEAVRIDSLQNTTFKGAGFFAPTGGEGGEIRLANAAGSLNYILDCGPANQIRYLNANNTDQVFLNNSVERVRITAAGSVGIGTNAPNSLLEVGDGTGQRVVRINGGLTNSADGAALYIQNGASTTAAFGHYSAIIGGPANSIPTLYSGGDTVFYNAGAERMRISGGGEVVVGGYTDNGAYNLQCNGTAVWGAGAYVNGSDERIKEEIAPLGDSLNVINSLNPVTFKYKEEWIADRSTQTGFIAQEVEQVLDNEIYKDGIVQLGGQYMGLAYQSLIPLVVKAIQELSAKLDTLTDRVEALEA